jgi:hypothetical protein
MSIDAWREGIGRATGQPYTRPVPSVCGQLVAAFNTHCPPGLDVLDWAGNRAEFWAATHKGRTLNPFAFIAWLDSDQPPPYERGVTPSTPKANGGGESAEDALRRASKLADEELARRAHKATYRDPSEPTKMGGGHAR